MNVENVKNWFFLVNIIDTIKNMRGTSILHINCITILWMKEFQQHVLCLKKKKKDQKQSYSVIGGNKQRNRKSTLLQGVWRLHQKTTGQSEESMWITCSVQHTHSATASWEDRGWLLLCICTCECSHMQKVSRIKKCISIHHLVSIFHFAHLKPKNATNLKEKLKCCKVFTQSWCINKNKMHQSTNETDFLKQIILYMKHGQICVDCRSINYIISLHLLLLQ